MENSIIQKLEKLRSLMRENNIDAFIVNGSDPHMSEYVPDRWKTREYLSGFSGSYGFMAITSNKAALWTDSRYFIQAKQQLAQTGIEMCKARTADELTLEQWLLIELEPNSVLSFDPSCYSLSEILSLEKELARKNICFDTENNLLDRLWNKRPEIPNGPAFLHPEQWAGYSRIEKIKRLRKSLNANNADYLIVSSLDDLAWVFNIRGSDVEYNPVVMGFGLISANHISLFVSGNKFSDKAKNELTVDGVEIAPYETFYKVLEQLEGKTILIDPQRTNYKIYTSLNSSNKIVLKLSAPAMYKSVKNNAETEGMKKAHVADGLALLDFLLWLDPQLLSNEITEYDIALKINEVRTRKFGYIGPSFYPIVAYRDHGAIVHYSVNEKQAYKVQPEGILLIDSGGQYEYGTTDITRTFALGEPTRQMITDFTLVLKGMIALSTIKFPKGTAGCHLDVLARAALWKNNLNYGHGTGHGVGAFLNVHEGPQSIRNDFNSLPLVPGNIFSNEPGLYRTGEYGIRIENLMQCIEDTENDFGAFYRFETLTRFPIDTRLIDKNMLSIDEIEWVNHYHNEVFSALSPFTNTNEFSLLKKMTQTL